MLSTSRLSENPTVIFGHSKRLSRFGRNVRDLLNNLHILNENQITFISIAENIDLSKPARKLLFGILAHIAEFEREIIGEQSLENKIALAAKKIPSCGNHPFARKYDKKTGTWSLDENKAKLVGWAADEYLKGRSLKDISATLTTRYQLPLTYKLFNHGAVGEER